MSFFQMLVKDVEFDALIIRTVAQEDTNEFAVDSQEYIDARAICYFHPKDLNKIGVKTGNVYLKSDLGSVVVKIEESEREATEGLLTLPLGPWSLQLVGSRADLVADFHFKVKAKSTEVDITDIKSIILKTRGQS